jgi:hypothetical protein
MLASVLIECGPIFGNGAWRREPATPSSPWARSFHVQRSPDVRRR